MKLFNITENDSGQRLDKFLKKLLPNASSSLIYKLNRKNKIKINSKMQDNEYKLQIWDEVKIFLIDSEFDLLSKEQVSKIIDSNQKFDKKNIVYEDSSLFIINKESWINVHPWDYKTKEIDLITQIRDYLWEKLNSLTFSPSLVHRIDRDTSWLLLIAKKKDILTKLVADFKTHDKIKKTYYCIVFWKLENKSWIIDKKLLRIVDANSQDKVQVSDAGQVAITKYKLIWEKTIKTENSEIFISELEVEILTGRMHQIRVHLCSIWHPIILDNKYWDKKLNSFISKNYNLNRQALHAWKIEFFHYEKNKKVWFEANIKDDLKNFIKKL